MDTFELQKRLDEMQESTASLERKIKVLENIELEHTKISIAWLEFSTVVMQTLTVMLEDGGFEQSNDSGRTH